MFEWKGLASLILAQDPVPSILDHSLELDLQLIDEIDEIFHGGLYGTPLHIAIGVSAFYYGRKVSKA